MFKPVVARLVGSPFAISSEICHEVRVQSSSAPESVFEGQAKWYTAMTHHKTITLEEKIKTNQI